MDVTPLIPQGRQIIQSYQGDGFKVSGVFYQGSIIVTPERVIPWTAPANIADLKPENFEALKAEKPDVILLGTGKTMRLLPLPLKKSLKENGLSVDAMDTGAACRTYNVLMAEGRRIAAILLPFI
jgi:uncharacterized protein